MPEFAQGVCHDGAAILKDGQPMTIEEILSSLYALDSLCQLKAHRDQYGKSEKYNELKESAWKLAFEVLQK